jgi:hypothetical protein
VRYASSVARGRGRSLQRFAKNPGPRCSGKVYRLARSGPSGLRASDLPFAVEILFSRAFDGVCDGLPVFGGDEIQESLEVGARRTQQPMQHLGKTLIGSFPRQEQFVGRPIESNCRPWPDHKLGTHPYFRIGTGHLAVGSK